MSTPFERVNDKIRDYQVSFIETYKTAPGKVEVATVMTGAALTLSALGHKEDGERMARLAMNMLELPDAVYSLYAKAATTIMEKAEAARKEKEAQGGQAH